jgi:hypothetical protein
VGRCYCKFFGSQVLFSIAIKESILLSELNDFESEDVFHQVINLGNGIVLNDPPELDVNNTVDSPAIYHQKNIKNAHYDFYCSILIGQAVGLLPAQCKNTLNIPFSYGKETPFVLKGLNTKMLYS